MNAVPRALPLRSQSLLLSAVQPHFRSILSRSPSPPTVQAAFVSVKPYPTTPRVNPTQKLKIPPYQRQLSRPACPPPSKTEVELISLGYLVRRTPSIQLPIYRKWTSGGNRQVILIKKIGGDRKKLLEDISQAINVSKEDIRINPTTQHIEIKGDYYDKARSWLLESGF